MSLGLQKRVSLAQSIGAGPDALFCLPFAIAFFRLKYSENR
ncbi:MAG TPA: hypothetical protein VEV17_17570 [Bryobacteraceae bacterium]|nr:hypothetical protein [Bryobacteraceae bacterium]